MRNSDVARFWMRWSSAKGSNFFTDGTTIWSYGSHFPIAHRTNGNVYFNKDGRSVTTSIHSGHVARALGYDNRQDLLKNHDERIVLVDTETLRQLMAGKCPPDVDCRSCSMALKGIVDECDKKAVKVTA